MKKVLMLVSLLFCSQTIFAQLEKGMIAVGLSSQISTNKKTDESTSPSSNYNNENTTKTTIFKLGPDISYFISNRFAIGLAIGYSGNKTITESNNSNQNIYTYDYSKSTSNGMYISPYVKYYIPLNDNIYFFLRGGISTNFNSGTTSGYRDTASIDTDGNVLNIGRSHDTEPRRTNATSFSANINPGILFMPSKKIGLEFTLGSLIGYTYSENKNGSNNKETINNLQLLNFSSFTLGTSLYYFF